VRPSAADYDESSRVERHKFRGRTYTFTELSIADYDKLVAQATTKDEATGIERQDDIALMKLLVLKTVDITPREYANAGTRIILSLNRIVRDMHYGTEPEELIKDDDSDDAKSDNNEGDSPGNGE
jgi:hypothetical protein